MARFSLCGPLRKISAFSAVIFNAKGAEKSRRSQRCFMLTVSNTIFGRLLLFQFS